MKPFSQRIVLDSCFSICEPHSWWKLTLIQSVVELEPAVTTPDCFIFEGQTWFFLPCRMFRPFDALKGLPMSMYVPGGRYLGHYGRTKYSRFLCSSTRDAWSVGLRRTQARWFQGRRNFPCDKFYEYENPPDSKIRGQGTPVRSVIEFVKERSRKLSPL